MTRPDSCPDCGTGCRYHTGTYCQQCGFPLVKDVRALPRAINVGDTVRCVDSETPDYGTVTKADHSDDNYWVRWAEMEMGPYPSWQLSRK